MNHRDPSSNRVPRTTPEQRAQWVRRYRQSGLSQQWFAAQHGIGWPTLARWLRDAATVIVALPAPPRLQEVPLSSWLRPSPWAAEIAFAVGTTLRLASALAGSLCAKAGSQVLPRQYMTRLRIILSRGEKRPDSFKVVADVSQLKLPSLDAVLTALGLKLRVAAG